MLLAEAMDQLQSLFIDTARARVGSGPPIDFNEWDRRKHEALARRESAAAIGSTLRMESAPRGNRPTGVSPFAHVSVLCCVPARLGKTVLSGGHHAHR